MKRQLEIACTRMPARDETERPIAAERRVRSLGRSRPSSATLGRARPRSAMRRRTGTAGFIHGERAITNEISPRLGISEILLIEKVDLSESYFFEKSCRDDH